MVEFIHMNRVLMIRYVYIYCSEKYNIMKVNLGCVFKCIYKLLSKKKKKCIYKRFIKNKKKSVYTSDAESKLSQCTFSATRYCVPKRFSGTVSRLCLPPPSVGSIPTLVVFFSAPSGSCPLLRVGFNSSVGFFQSDPVEVAASGFYSRGIAAAVSLS